MKTDKETRHRIAVDVGHEMYEKIQEHVPWGTMKHLIIAMLKDFLHLCEKHDSRIIIGAILSEEISLKDFLNKFEEEESGEEDGY